MRLFSLLALGLLVGTAGASYGQTTPADTTRQAVNTAKAPNAAKPNKITILPVPVLFYQQETGAGYGLGGLLSGRLGQDTTTRASNARVQFWTTQKSQSLVQFVHTVYSPGEKFYLNGEISSYKNRLYYFGIGNEAPAVTNAHRSFLDFQLFIINQRVQKSIAKNQFLGLQYRLSRVYNLSQEQGRVNDDGDQINPAGDPATQNYFNLDPRLDQRQRLNFSLSGIGPVYTLDSRDVALAASKGNLLDLQVMFNGKFVGSDYNFVRYQIDARHYQRIFSDKTILALQFLGQFHSGNVPWYGLAGIGANLGGTLYDNANLMRGIYEQRFRDRQLMTAQAELRQHLFWRLDGAAFLGVGQVGYNISDYTFGGIHTAGGIGARFNFIRRDRVNLRFDYAFGTDPGFYFAIGEAF
ncbi:BamA/TamA family outer membrane protein [Hymenobacter sp. RP-2-7]|uniref:BamA/TamA family outer membrane protein n=1 Tax=Hymenobacter polaris TaxID=2682546 RepID=A0A7Y0AFG3_9BACT|nr:BamA/TamA family outer membrane protein [Hymenobacter polaris]NML66197.1 BamA/TamA family outer membrane protein [Hymenobacter polaris]